MKGQFPVYAHVFLLLSGLLSVTSCGLRYTPPPSSETLEAERRLSLESQFSTSYKSIGKTYVPHGYGDLTVVKPNSYKKLDSLYAIKYRQEQNGYVSRDLEADIEQQRLRVFADTNPVLYIETHWFELRQDSLSEFIVAEASLNKQNRLKDVHFLDAFEAKGSHIIYARKYFLESWFVRYAEGLSGEEWYFYKTYKEQAGSLAGAERQAFLEHTFSIMALANKQGTLSTEVLLKQLSYTRLPKDENLNISNMVITVNEMVTEGVNGPAFSHYEVSIKKTGSDAAPLVFKYDRFLRAIS